MFDESILKNEEKAVFALRALYSSHGYKPYKMSKFEEYDLYMRNKDFLVSDGIITFSDTNGRLLALKPDVTLSIIKNYQDQPGTVQKVCYNENVYRISGSTRTYKEIMQTGLECIGDISVGDTGEVLCLALDSLQRISAQYLLDAAHIGFVYALLAECGISFDRQEAVLEAVAAKNAGQLADLCDDTQFAVLQVLLRRWENVEAALKDLRAMASGEDSRRELTAFADSCAAAETAGFGDHLRVDFSIIRCGGYYSGLLFRGYIPGVASTVLSGGQYDKLMQKMGRQAGAIGFAVYLDTLERLEQPDEQKIPTINIALPKGRLGEKVYGMFEAAGFECPSIREPNRRLIFENSKLRLNFFWVKPSDVAIYVERGAADIGVAGKDILLEYTPDVYELLDLDIGKCRMAVAGKTDFRDDPGRTLRVATKFSNIASRYYAEQGRNIDIIHLNGSIELAPILGLSDVIVDIVETGKTLQENNLQVVETIVPISARLIANKAAYTFKHRRIGEIRQGLAEQIQKK